MVKGQTAMYIIKSLAKMMTKILHIQSYRSTKKMVILYS